MRPRAKTIFAAGLVLAALAGGGARPQTPSDGLSAPASASVPPQPPATTAQSSAASLTCGAASLAWLVGKPTSAIPVPIYPGRRRVSCSTCLVTQDYVPGRTDIIFDSATGLITEVKCG